VRVHDVVSNFRRAQVHGRPDNVAGIIRQALGPTLRHVVVSHTRTVSSLLSTDAEASRFPSGLHAQQLTAPPCPSSVAALHRVLAYHTLKPGRFSLPRHRMPFDLKNEH